MTDPRPPLSDEDLSAVLDGEAPADVVAAAEADPVARVRLDQLRAASAALRAAAVPPLEASVVDGLVARALAAPAGTVDDPGQSDGVVAPLAPRRSRPGGGLRPGLVAAAVVLLVGVGLALVWSGRDDGSVQDAAVQRSQEEASTAADEGAGTEGAGGDGGVAAERSADEPAADEAPASTGAAPHGVPTTAPAADAEAFADGLRPLGSFADADALREALKAGFPSSPSSKDRAAGKLTNEAVARCDTIVRTVLGVEGQARRQGVATVDGAQVLVFEYGYTLAEDPSATTLVVAAGSEACNVIASFVR